MADILEFRLVAARRSRRHEPSARPCHGGDVVIFPGVRIERRDPAQAQHAADSDAPSPALDHQMAE